MEGQPGRDTSSPCSSSCSTSSSVPSPDSTGPSSGPRLATAASIPGNGRPIEPGRMSIER